MIGDPREQRRSLERIQSVWRADPRLRVVPSHCPSLVGGLVEKEACA
jgi:hypothetical protein